MIFSGGEYSNNNDDQCKTGRQVIYLVELNNTSYYSVGICIQGEYCIASFDLNTFLLYISRGIILLLPYRDNIQGESEFGVEL